MNLDLKTECEALSQPFDIPLSVLRPDDGNGNTILDFEVKEPDVEAFKKYYPGHKLSGTFSRKINSVFPL